MSVIFTGPGAARTVSAASGGKVYGYNAVSTTPAEVAPANPQRQKITFHNPGTVDLYIAPVLIQTTGLSVAFSPTTSALGGCFLVYANGGALAIEGECQGAWQALAASGSDNSLTVMDSNV